MRREEFLADLFANIYTYIYIYAGLALFGFVSERFAKPEARGVSCGSLCVHGTCHLLQTSPLGYKRPPRPQADGSDPRLCQSGLIRWGHDFDPEPGGYDWRSFPPRRQYLSHRERAAVRVLCSLLCYMSGSLTE